MKAMPLGRQVPKMQAPVPANTKRLPFGPLCFGVEFRSLNSVLPDVWEQPDGTMFVDEGVTIHVWDATGDSELLRFDCFLDDPHYHYRIPDDTGYVVVPYDPFANGDDMVDWTFRCLRTRLPAMLGAAGAESIAPDLDPEALNEVLDECEMMAQSARVQPG